MILAWASPKADDERKYDKQMNEIEKILLWNSNGSAQSQISYHFFVCDIDLEENNFDF